MPEFWLDFLLEAMCEQRGFGFEKVLRGFWERLFEQRNYRLILGEREERVKVNDGCFFGFGKREE